MVMEKTANSKKVTAFMRFEYLPGSLDDRTRELVLLSAGAVAGCSH